MHTTSRTFKQHLTHDWIREKMRHKILKEEEGEIGNCYGCILTTQYDPILRFHLQ